jgi:hypothetical chaperone protein
MSVSSAPKNASVVLGIDFGTSNSAVSYIDLQGEFHSVLLDQGSNAMPTALFFSSEDEKIMFGKQAMQQYLAGTEGRLMRSIKSLLGSSLMDEQTVVNGQSITFFDVLVIFIKELKARAEKSIGAKVEHVVLGRPVHFVDDHPEKDQLAQDTLGKAALAAGFKKIGFQLEPIAAALDFEQRLDQETTVLVVDIGGGTSDFTCIKLNPKRSSVANRQDDILATTGVHIGGTDFDRLLNLAQVSPQMGFKHKGKTGREVPSGIFFDLSTWHLIHQAYSRKSMHAAKELRSDFSDTQLHARLMQVLEEQLGHRILASVEDAKIECSVNNASSSIELALMGSEWSSVELFLDAENMKKTLAEPLQNIVNCAQHCLSQAQLEKVDVIYLTGGSSALRPLIEVLQESFPQSLLVHGDRFGGVAAGLAYAGQHLLSV